MFVIVVVATVLYLWAASLLLTKVYVANIPKRKRNCYIAAIVASDIGYGVLLVATLWRMT